MKQIILLHIYPDLLNLYGEYANLLILARYLKEEGADVAVRSVQPCDPIPENASLLYLGCGTESASLRARRLLLDERDTLNGYREKGTPILATGNSFELFGKTISDDRFGTFDGLGFYDYTVSRTHEKRYLGDAVLTCPFFSDKVIGFINKCSSVTDVVSPLFEAEMGPGNDNLTPGEGFTDGNFYGTSLIGPLLIRNPAFCRFLMDKIYETSGFTPSASASMSLQNKAYALALFELSARLQEEKNKK